MATEFADVTYVSLETFRKDGTGVRTPVWIAEVGGKLVVGTEGSTFKVKRIVGNAKVRLAQCNASGKTIVGPWRDGTARILRGADAKPGEDALTRKYGWQRRLFEGVSKLLGRVKDRVIIEIELSAS